MTQDLIIPSIGRIVHFVMPDRPGQIRPAIVTNYFPHSPLLSFADWKAAVFHQYGEQAPGTEFTEGYNRYVSEWEGRAMQCNLRIFTDGSNDPHGPDTAMSCRYSAAQEPGTWHWPKR
jgi:hypothetical protein